MSCFRVDLRRGKESVADKLKQLCIRDRCRCFWRRIEGLQGEITVLDDKRGQQKLQIPRGVSGALLQSP